MAVKIWRLHSSDRDMGFNIKLMVLIMKAIGSLTNLKGKGHFGIVKMKRMEYTVVNSKMEWQMGMDSIAILTVLSIKENSKMMCKMVKVKKHGLMGLITLEAIKME